MNTPSYFFVLPCSCFVLQLLRQQIELIGAEGVELEFDDDAVREIARMAAQLNKTVENIGARRLHTVLERIMETISFDAAELETGAVRSIYCLYDEAGSGLWSGSGWLTCCFFSNFAEGDGQQIIG